MSIRFGFDVSPDDDSIVVSGEDGVAIIPDLTWDEVIGDGYVEDDYEEGYA
jgi:hypothetical protein